MVSPAGNLGIDLMDAMVTMPNYIITRTCLPEGLTCVYQDKANAHTMWNKEQKKPGAEL